MQMSKIVKNAFVEFHTKKDGFYYEERSTSTNHFGVFFLELNESPILKTPQFVYSSNDMSGSMSEYCDDGSTKMKHLHTTLENIIALFSKKSAEIGMEIVGFDNIITEVISATKINHNDERQVNEICKKINKILKPRNSTDIGLALNHAKSKLGSELSSSFSEKHFIFMTDGNITKGEKKIANLQSQIPTGSRNYFIGFGIDHDYILLQSLAETYSDAYYYVDKIENAGLVFGEIIHSILYTALKDIIITVENGEIYDFVKNEWTDKIKVPYLCGEAKKQYHVRSATPELFEITHSACEVSTGNIYMSTEIAVPDLENGDGEIIETDLRKYMYRQVTLQLLSEALELAKKYNRVPYEEQEELREKIYNFRHELQIYANDCSNENEQQFMKQLCDDLYICEKMMNSKYMLLYTNVRKTSQGSGGSYNITKIENYQFYNDDYEISQDALNRSNTSETQCEIMRECSQRYNDDDTYII